jgi:hypothetical protein
MSTMAQGPKGCSIIVSCVEYMPRCNDTFQGPSLSISACLQVKMQLARLTSVCVPGMNEKEPIAASSLLEEHRLDSDTLHQTWGN